MAFLKLAPGQCTRSFVPAKGLSVPPRSARAFRVRTARVQAVLPSFYELADAANTAATAASQAANSAVPPPGSVNAPIGVIIGSALVVTLALTASGFLLKPGVEAAEKLQKEQSGKWRK
ncbi:hypothetical protein WJX73_009294 [Symbiochloris irregularis]|uniref:Uncharacterized protein n=1 Tax=Symbiochloris irregularis TaxID=706552 RepID=A0AAW1NX13_9CHLO